MVVLPYFHPAGPKKPSVFVPATLHTPKNQSPYDESPDEINVAVSDPDPPSKSVMLNQHSIVKGSVPKSQSAPSGTVR